MGAKILLTAEEYLRTPFQPDADFVDGEIVERNVGENQHSKVQVWLVVFFAELAKNHPLHIRTELRMRVSATRFRVADLAIWMGEEPQESVPASPPLLVAEIVSPDDRYTEIISKLEDYRKWGVRHIWLIDPWSRRLHTFGPAGLNEVAALKMAELGVEILPPQIF